MAKPKNEKEVVEENQTVEIYYEQNITIENHGTVIIKQSGQPTNPPTKPPGQ